MSVRLLCFKGLGTTSSRFRISGVGVQGLGFRGLGFRGSRFKGLGVQGLGYLGQIHEQAFILRAPENTPMPHRVSQLATLPSSSSVFHQ